MIWTSPIATVAAAALIVFLPAAVRTLGWLFGLRMILRASRPEERAALLDAFAPVSATLHTSNQMISNPDTRLSPGQFLGTETDPHTPDNTHQKPWQRGAVEVEPQSAAARAADKHPTQISQIDTQTNPSIRVAR
jgi:hypothetical protein